jgi:SNF2 family DNA or RNA helicase
MFLHYLYENLKVTGPFFIVVPLSTLGNWERELKNWTDMNTVVFRGRETARNLIVDGEFFYRTENDAVIPGLYKFDILLTTYDMCNEPCLKSINWRCAVLDEVCYTID